MIDVFNGQGGGRNVLGFFLMVKGLRRTKNNLLITVVFLCLAFVSSFQVFDKYKQKNRLKSQTLQKY
jgi:hypothetical protein